MLRDWERKGWSHIRRGPAASGVYVLVLAGFPVSLSSVPWKEVRVSTGLAGRALEQRLHTYPRGDLPHTDAPQALKSASQAPHHFRWLVSLSSLTHYIFKDRLGMGNLVRFFQFSHDLKLTAVDNDDMNSYLLSAYPAFSGLYTLSHVIHVCTHKNILDCSIDFWTLLNSIILSVSFGT